MIFDDDDTSIRMQEIQFDWMRLARRELLPGIVMQDINLMKNYLDYMRDDIVVEFNGMVLGQKLPPFSVSKSAVIETPSTPWQHFKEFHSQKWWMRKIVKKWPVKKLSNKIDFTATWEQWASYPWQEKVHSSHGFRPVRVVLPPTYNTRVKGWKDAGTQDTTIT